MDAPLAGRAVYAGSFDPLTNGHLNLLRRAAGRFNEIIVGVGENPKKDYLFNVDERVRMVENEIKDLSNVSVRSFNGLLISFAEEVGAKVILRGLRAATDFEYEFQVGLVNMDMNREIETFFLLTEPGYIFISSSTVKEIAYFRGDVDRYVPVSVKTELRKKYPLDTTE